MSLKSLGKIINAGKQLFKNGAAARTARSFKPTINFKGANGMRTAMFGTIGAAALGGTLASCSNQDDYYNDLTGNHKVELDLEKRDIPTKDIIVTKYDTIRVPEYINKTDTIWQDKIIEKHDTIQVPVYINKTDTIWQDKIIEKHDTIKVPEYITKTDTVYVDKVKTDTVYVKLPGETIEVPTNPEFKGEVEPVLDDITDILTPGEDTEGTTVLMKGIKMFEQHAVEARLDGRSTSEREQVYGMHVVDFEDDHNPTTYVKQMKVGKTFINGQAAAVYDIIPPNEGSKKLTYSAMNPGGWNINKAKRVAFVPDKANNRVIKYVQDAYGKFTEQGYLKRDEHGHVQDYNNLSNGETWQQKIDNLQFINSKRFLNELHPGSYGQN